MLVQHFLEQSAARLADKVALICGDDRLTYLDVDSQSDSLARYLRNLGVQRQDRVAILLDNSIASVISLFGILKADAIFVILSPTMKAPKLSYILNDCSVEVLITHPRKTRIVSKALANTPSVRHVVWVGQASAVPSLPTSEAQHHGFAQALSAASYPPSPSPSSNIDMDLAAIIYTSGSTGDPKGVMLTHLNMVSAATSIIGYLENQEDDIILNVLPLSFDYGLYQVLMAFKFGGTVVLERSFGYPYKVIDKMVQEKVTGFPGVPTIFAILLQLRDLKKYDFGSLRYITNTAAHLPVDFINKLKDSFPHVRIFPMYGLTECKRVAYLPPEQLESRPESVGKGMPNEEVWIVDEQGRPVGPHVVGELVVRGSNVMLGYWGLTEETDQVLRQGTYPGEKALYTGDLFKMDQDGFLYFVGRKDDMIKTKGERISPREIENCLHEMDGVVEAAVIGVPDHILGQAIQAFVAFRDGYVAKERDIIQHCRKNLEDFAVPKAVHCLDSLPKTPNGKIDKLALREMER
ncbi:MAG: AMP-binding protein [Thermodesulfobacteriota bacterium]|nr:AMP-binding protein [Thermodesulfobacteriota bacterium]